VLKILLVEDDLLSASVLSQLLAELNYTIDAVNKSKSLQAIWLVKLEQIKVVFCRIKKT
jgi:CheY-like chemotaxis protein